MVKYQAYRVHLPHTQSFHADPKKVQALAESISEIGLQEPVSARIWGLNLSGSAGKEWHEKGSVSYVTQWTWYAD